MREDHRAARGGRTRRAKVPLLATLALAALAAPLGAQSMLERTPHMSAGWTGNPGQIQFNVVHRFIASDPPERKVSAFPTFVIGVPIQRGLLAGVTYATSSLVAPSKPNEFELFGRFAPLREATHGIDAYVQASYNVGPGSADGELGLARSVGRLRLLAAARAFSDGYDAGEARFAVAGGAVLRLTNAVALAADVATLTDREAREEVAWGVGLQLGIPYSPHSLGIHVSNVQTGSLQGASVGTDRLRVGFEFTIPVTLARIFGSPVAGPPRPPAAAGAGPGAPVAGDGEDVFHAELRALAFAPGILEVPVGATVVWTNADDVVHTVTARDNSWGSTAIEPGGSFARTFDQPGRYVVYCIPHPFMVMEVVVTE